MTNRLCIRGILFFLILGLFYFSSGCKKKSEIVPYVQVNEYLNLYLPEYLNLSGNGWVYYNAGYKGLIVYRKTPTEFAAYDRTCTYDPYSSGIVSVETNSVFAKDSLCGSEYEIVNGSVTHGPAAYPLKSYKTELLPNNVLHIYN